MSPPNHEDEIVHLARRLAFDHQLDVAQLLRLNANRLNGPGVNAIAWSRLVATIDRFLETVSRAPWSVQLVRITSASVREHTRSNSLDFKTLCDGLVEALRTEDPRVAYWTAERRDTESIRFTLPPDGVADIDQLKKVLVEWIPAWARPAVAPSTEKSVENDAPVSDVDEDPRQPEQTPKEEASVTASAPATATPDDGAKRPMGQTFNLNDADSTKRTLFQYWVWNEDTDEVLDHASVIVPGDTDQEATLNLKMILKERLAEKAGGASVRMRVEKIETFEKRPKDQQVSLDKMLSALRGAIVDNDGSGT